jgi:hypothetical protein
MCFAVSATGGNRSANHDLGVINMNFRNLMVAAVAVAASASSALATSVFFEQFDYSAGPLNGTLNWERHSGTDNQIQIIDSASQSGNSLVSPVSGVTAPAGNRITINGTDSEDISRSFTPITGDGNSAYAGFLVRFTAQPSAGGTYFAHFTEGTAVGGTGFRARLWSRSSGSGFNLGLSRSGNTPVWGSTEYNLNQTYHIVLRYSMVSGATNDIVDLHVDPSNLSVEGTPTLSYSGSDADANNATGLGRFAFRQATGIGTIEIDQVQVATTYATAAPLPVSLSEFSAE